MKIKIDQTDYKYISDNSKECSSNTAFFLCHQNRAYIDEAKAKSPPAILTPQKLQDIFLLHDIKIVGITGTNGKTTTAAAIYSFLMDLGESVALLGTRGFFINDKKIESKSLTTPPLLQTMYNLYQAVQKGCKYFIMEVSSHAIDQQRIESLEFALKIFTNITQDHLDYHGTFEEYKRVKSLFFQDESLKLINKDAQKIDFNIKNCYTYALNSPASFNIVAYSLNNGINGIIKHFEEQESFYSPLYGEFNIYNILAAISAVKLLTTHSLHDITEVVENFGGVSGRMETILQDPLIIVDFAHTPDGIQKVLESFKNKNIIVVFGAGGNRDKSKRALMGKVADRYAKKIYLTSDNPRDEDPLKIINDIYQGVYKKDKVIVEVDRKRAIEQAIDNLQNDEILLILGKGDEEFQEIKGKFVRFDDRAVIRGKIKEKFNI